MSKLSQPFFPDRALKRAMEEMDIQDHCVQKKKPKKKQRRDFDNDE